MTYFRATLRDELRSKLGLGPVPVRPPVGGLNASPSPEPRPAFPEAVPQPNILRDPILDQARSLEQFRHAQVLDGMALIRQGRGVDNLVDQVNLDAAKEALDTPGLEPIPMHPMQQPGGMGPEPFGGFCEPFNNPFSSVPGA